MVFYFYAKNEHLLFIFQSVIFFAPIFQTNKSNIYGEKVTRCKKKFHAELIFKLERKQNVGKLRTQVEIFKYRTRF